MAKIGLIFLCLLLIVPTTVKGDCTCDPDDEDIDKPLALRYKIGAIASILVAGAVGVGLPVLGKVVPALQPETGIFFAVKAFAAGVILSTGFIHVFPDAFESLTSPCLKENPWGKFPFAGFVAMVLAIGTLMVDSFATSYFSSRKKEATASGEGDEENAAKHATHGHSHVSANFKGRAMVIMGLFFSLTTPLGIAIGIGISKVYNEKSPKALIVEGVFDAASAGILIYMSLVDMLAADFMHPKVQSSALLHVGVYVFLLLGAACMSLLAMWA